MVSFQESFATAIDGTRIYVRERPGRVGTAPVTRGAPLTALLCDGLVCDGFIYKHLWDELGARMPVAHFNYRAHGRSEAPRDPTRIDVTALATDLNAVRDHIGDPPVVLIGHSLGTQVALEAYRLNPDRVRAMVLLCGSFGRITHTFRNSDLLASVLPGILEFAAKHPRLARGVWGRLPIKTAVRVAQLTGEIDPRVSPEDIEPYFRHVADFDFGVFVRMLTLAGEHSAQDLLPHVSVPVLVVGGENDAFTPKALSEAMAEALPQGELFIVPGGTHVAPLEQPEVLWQRLAAFLDAHAVLS